MHVSEWFLFVALLAFGSFPVLLALRRFPPWTRWLTVVIAITVAVGAAAWTAKRIALAVNREKTAQVLPREGRPGGYVSSDKCQACHPSQYETWHRSFHRTMTQLATPATMDADFSGQSFELSGISYHLRKSGDEYSVEVKDPIGRTAQKKVGLLTGSHHMQVPWISEEHGNVQAVLPFAWLKDDQRWAPFHATFLRDPKIPPAQHVWNVSCIQCHATGGQPKVDSTTRTMATQVGELGIACEACHGPGEEHVRLNSDPVRRYGLHNRKQGDSAIVNPARLDHRASSQVCGQCHGIKWIRENFRQDGFSFRPGKDLAESAPIVQPTKLEQQPWLKEPLKQNPTFLADHYWPDGMVRVSGRDYNGLIESPCYKKGNLSCLSCHSMHQSEPNNQLSKGMESNEACYQCHGGFREKLAAHSHHSATSSGSLCYNCHMPYTTYGLLKAIRSHQISNPEIKTTLATGRPNACNLCHLDKTMAWSSSHLTEWYGQPTAALTSEQQTISAALLWALKGDAGQRALIAWSMSWPPARKASGESWLPPYLGQLLDDPYSAVRYIAARSLKQLPGFESLTYDFVAGKEERSRAKDQVLANWKNYEKTSGENILIRPDGTLRDDQIKKLLSERDDHSMDLQE
jgi:predicted CXXCH cytochrome family protein